MAGIDTRAGTSYAWTDACEMLGVCEGFTKGDAIGWIEGYAAAQTLRGRARATGGGFVIEGNTIAGRPALVSRSAGDATLSVCDWSKVWHATWGALEVAVDPFTDFKSGKVTLRVWLTVDFGFSAPAQVTHASAIT